MSEPSTRTAIVVSCQRAVTTIAGMVASEFGGDAVLMPQRGHVTLANGDLVYVMLPETIERNICAMTFDRLWISLDIDNKLQRQVVQEFASNLSPQFTEVFYF